MKLISVFGLIVHPVDDWKFLRNVTPIGNCHRFMVTLSVLKTTPLSFLVLNPSVLTFRNHTPA